MHGRVPLRSQREGFPAAAVEEEDAVDLRGILNFLLRRWKLIAATALAAMLLAFVVTMTLTPRYTATAQVLLEPKKDSIFGADRILPELNLDTGNVDSQISVIQSINLLQRVVEKHALTSDSEFSKEDRPGLVSVIKAMIWPAPEEPAKAPEADQIPPQMLRAITRLRNALSVSRVARTYVLSISITSEDPIQAMRLANAVADAYVVDRLDARYEAAKRASTWLTERIEALREQVRQSEEAVAKFRQEHNLTVSSEGKVAVSEQQLAELNARLITARAEAAEKGAKYEQAQQVKEGGGNLQAIPDVVRSSVISDLRKQEAEVTRKEADLAARYSGAHPTVVNVRAERRDIERNILAEVGRIIANLRNDYEVARAREASLQASLSDLTGQGGDGVVGIRLRELERVVAANRTLFENFLSRAKITHEQAAFEEREARVISPATKPTGPSYPKRSQILLLALILGAGLGLGGALALDMLSSGFSNAQEIENALGRPVLSSLPLLSASDRKIDGAVADPVNYLLKKPLSRFAEQVRAVRVGVQMADVDNPAKVVLVTSSVPREGKSTLVSCLAFSAAKSGQRVILIDGDLRHPTTSKHFGLQGRPGLVDFLTGEARFEDVLVNAGALAVLPAGSNSQNPADLLGSQRMKQMIAQLREAYDYIVMDSPPVAPVVDARVMQQLADKIIYVVRWHATPREVVSQCLEQLAPDRRLAGICLNLVDEAKAYRYGPYSYYSKGGYRGYYQQ